MSSFNSTVSGESWTTLSKVVIGVWLVVWLYAALHNLYLIRIAPEHFTVWHYKMPFFTNYTMLGIAYAFAASISPGVMLGVFLYIAGRLFNRPKLTPKQIILSTVWVWVGVEICAGTVGVIVWRTGKALYPDWVYPDDSMGLLITQSIQITAYLTGAVFSCILIAHTWQKRKSLTSRCT
jgi:CDP-diglyceride synthetase